MGLPKNTPVYKYTGIADMDKVLDHGMVFADSSRDEMPCSEFILFLDVPMRDVKTL